MVGRRKVRNAKEQTITGEEGRGCRKSRKKRTTAKMQKGRSETGGREGREER